MHSIPVVGGVLCPYTAGMWVGQKVTEACPWGQG